MGGGASALTAGMLEMLSRSGGQSGATPALRRSPRAGSRSPTAGQSAPGMTAPRPPGARPHLRAAPAAAAAVVEAPQAQARTAAAAAAVRAGADERAHTLWHPLSMLWMWNKPLLPEMHKSVWQRLAMSSFICWPIGPLQPPARVHSCICAVGHPPSWESCMRSWQAVSSRHTASLATM